MAIFHLDIETSSAVPIKYGAARQATDTSTRILLCAVAKDDGPVHLWDRHSPDTSREALSLLQEISEDPEALVYCHNVLFEMLMLEYQWEPTFGFRKPNPEQYRCTQALCRVARIPQSLEKAAEFLKLDIRKNSIGKLLIKKFSIPQKVRGKDEHFWLGPDHKKTFTLNKEKTTAAQAWGIFREYCRADVEVERQIHKRLKPLELKGWVLDAFQMDARLNLRGVPVDLAAVDKALAIVEEITVKVTEEFRALTGLNPGQNQKVKQWLQARGYPGHNLQAATVSAILGQQITDDEADEEDEETEEQEEAGALDTSKMTPEAWDAVNLYAKVGYAALKKLPAMKNSACPDGRLRGMFLWSGAGTGRYTSKIVQLQNLKRPTKTSETIFRLIRDGGVDADTLDLLFGAPLDSVSSAIRHFIGYPDKPIIGADYAQIEARILPWLAGHHESVQMFREGKDAYSIAAAATLGVDYETAAAKHRQLGKVIVLACIAENQWVLTSKGEILIQDITSSHEVWDGENFVKHDGLVDRGIRDVIYYGGLSATPDHEVFLENGKSTEFGYAARMKLKLMKGHKGNRRPEGYPTRESKMRVYDIANCGPRHRFSVQGVIVHNCGYAGGMGAMDAACVTYRMELTPKEKRKTVKDWRKANAPIVKLWKELGDASIEAVQNPGKWVRANDKARFGYSSQLGYPCLVMELPSKRKLYYPYPEVKEVFKIKRLLPGVTPEMIPNMEAEGLDTHEWKQIPRYQAMGADGVLFKGVWATWDLTYFGQIKGSKKWGRLKLHPGVITENLTQSVGSDFLTFGALECERRGFQQILTVHDEYASEYEPEKGQTAKNLVDALCVLPPWAQDFPLEAVGDVVPFYTK